MVRGLPSRGRWSVGSSVAPTCQTAVSWPLARVTDRAYGVAGEIPGNLMADAAMVIEWVTRTIQQSAVNTDPWPT